MMEGRRGLDQPLRHAIEETWAVFNPETGTPDLALLLARLSDLARSNAFLWMKAGLSAQEHATRLISSRAVFLPLPGYGLRLGRYCPCLFHAQRTVEMVAAAGEALGLGPAARA